MRATSSRLGTPSELCLYPCDSLCCSPSGPIIVSPSRLEVPDRKGPVYLINFSPSHGVWLGTPHSESVWCHRDYWMCSNPSFINLLFYCQTPEGTVSTVRKKILTLYTWKVEKGLGKFPSILGLHRTYCYSGVLNTFIQVYSWAVPLLYLEISIDMTVTSKLLMTLRIIGQVLR